MTNLKRHPVGRTELVGRSTSLTRAFALLALALMNGACEKVTVTGALVAGLELTPPDASVIAGQTVKFTAILVDDVGNQLGGRQLAWSVDDPNVASVSDGTVRGLSQGVTTVRATTEGATGSAGITVLKAPTVGLATSSVTFAAASDGPRPDPVIVAVFNDGAGSLEGLTVTVEYGAGPPGWLTAALSGSTAPTTLTVSADPAGMAPGAYVANVRIASALGSESSLAVTFDVGESAPVIGVSSSQVAFDLQMGQGAVTQTVAVTNLGGEVLSGLGAGVAYGEGDPGGWLVASLSPTTAPSQLAITADPTFLQVGTYGAQVYISAPEALNTPVIIGVTLTLQELRPRIALATESVSFSAQSGEQPPAPRTVAVQNGGGGSLTGLAVAVNYSSTATGWLAASLDGTEAPATLTVGVDHRGLDPGSYVADVVVTSAVAENSPATLRVTLTVGSPPPSITLTPTEVRFSTDQGQSDPPPAAVTVTNGGGGALTGLSSSVIYPNGGATGWLVAELDGTSAPATLTLTPSTGQLGAGSYTATVRVASDQGGVAPADVAVILTVGARPAAPSNLSAAALSPTSVELSWNDNSDDEDGFVVERQTGGGPWTQIASPSANSTGYVDATASPETSYGYRVSACRNGVCSDPSNVASVTTPPEQVPPDPPGNLVATAVSRDVVDLVWTDASDNETSFALQRSTDGGATWGALTETGPDVTSYSDTGLPASTTFWYRVRACNAYGCSAWSSVASATTLDPPPPPNGPTGLGVTSASYDSVVLGWTDASDTEDSFQVQRSVNGGASWTTVATLGPNATSFTDTSVDPETSYSYRVRACLEDQCSGYSNVANVTTPPAPQPPAAPSGLTATPISQTRIDLTWTDNSDNEDRFEIQWRRNPNWQYEATVGADVTTYSATAGVRKNDTYVFRVRACNVAGCSAWNTSSEVHTPL